MTTDSTDQTVGQRIREAREARSFTQQAVSVRSKWVDPEKKGISRTALIGYEAGSSRPGTRELRILCETLKVTPNALIFGSEHPFEATVLAREGLGMAGASLQDAVEIAFVLAALKGHEKEALLTLTLSLAGRQLGDARLSGLRYMAKMVTPTVAAELAKQAPDDTAEDIATLSLDKLVERISHGAVSNLGNKLQFEDGEIVGGEWLYEDPSGRDPKKKS